MAPGSADIGDKNVAEYGGASDVTEALSVVVDEEVKNAGVPNSDGEFDVVADMGY